MINDERLQRFGIVFSCSHSVVEEQYYFLVSAFIFLASKFFLYFFPSQASSDNDSDQASGSAPKFLHFLIYLTWFVSFCLCILTPESLIASKWKFFSVQFRFWEFLTGAILKLNEVRLLFTSTGDFSSFIVETQTDEPF